MPALKVRCPQCDAFIRKTIDAVDEPTDFNITCPKCGSEFVASAEPEARPAKQATKKPAKATRRRDDDEDDDDTPRKGKKKQKAAGTDTRLIVGGVAAGVLVIGGVVAAVLLAGGSKDKKTETAKNDPPPQQPETTPPGPNRMNPGSGNTGPSRPGPVTQGPGAAGTTGPGSTDTTASTNPPPKPQDPEDFLPPALRLPPPPKIRVSGSAVPPPEKGAGKLLTDRLPPFPPPTPDEDPFLRARRFAPDGAIPQPPRLPSKDQRPLLTLDPGGHTAFVKNVFITPRGDRVISVSEDKAVRVWDIKTGDPVHTVRLPAGGAQEGALHAAALSPDGKQLIVGGKPLESVKAGTVPLFVINVEHGTLQKTISVTTSALKNIVSAIDYSPDGTQVAAGCGDGTVQLFNVASGNSAGQVTGAHALIREIRFSPDRRSRTLATLGLEGAVKFWDLGNSARNRTLNVSSLKANAITWMSNGELLAVGGETGEIVLFNVADGQVVRTLPRLTFKDKTVDIHRMQFLAGDREIAFAGVASGPGYAGVISIETGAVTVPFTGHTNTIMGLRASADGKLVVTSGGNQNEIYVWSAADGKTVGRLSGNGNGIWGVGWAKDGKSIAWGTSNLISRDGHTALEGVFRFDDLGLGGAPDESKYDQSLTQDKKYVVKMVARDEVLMGNLDGQPALFSLPGHEPIFSASVLPNRGTAVVCGARSLVLVDIASGKPTVTRHFEGHTGNVTAIAPSPDGKYFVTGSSDQTIRIWKPDQEDPFLSLFVAGQEWIAWTPQGYYACSAHGEGLIAWQVNNTAYKFPQVYPAARFRPSLYQPALLKYLLPAGELRMAMAMAERYDQALVKTTNIADIIPPEVTIDSPAVTESGAPAVIDQETCTVKASARGTKHPVTAMKLLVDGRPFQGAGGVKRFDKPQSTAEVTWEVPLLPGSHTFVAIAETGVSRNMSKVAGVTRSGTPPKPNLYMLAIGISEYPTHKLHYAASDAKLLTRTFQEKSKGVFPVIETKVITDAEATRKNIRAGMDWLAAKMTPKDVGIVMFSGHGSRDLNGKVYLVPVDINDEDPTGTCLSGDEFKSRLENMPGRLVAILDSCHSGGVTENSRTGRVESLARDLAAEDSGVIVMCASLGREYSIEDNRTKAGYYTFGLVEGLSGHADIDEDGVIYITELDTYASARVKQISFGMQNPTLGRPPNIRPFPLALVPKDKKQ